jgi:hypothetical protein
MNIWNSLYPAPVVNLKNNFVRTTPEINSQSKISLFTIAPIAKLAAAVANIMV